MMTEGANIISKACEIFGVSGGRQKSIRSGGDIQQASTNPLPYSTRMSATPPAKPTEDLAATKKHEAKDKAVANILSILDGYKLEKRTNTKDLKELMKTNMFVPNSL
jgi:hypothetical protein